MRASRILLFGALLVAAESAHEQVVPTPVAKSVPTFAPSGRSSGGYRAACCSQGILREQESVFAVEPIQKLRAAAEKARQIPADLPDGWSSSAINPQDVVKVFHGLRLQKGIVLRGYLYHDTMLGAGKVWAFPAGATIPAGKASDLADKPDGTSAT